MESNYRIVQDCVDGCGAPLNGKFKCEYCGRDYSMTPRYVGPPIETYYENASSTALQFNDWPQTDTVVDYGG